VSGHHHPALRSGGLCAPCFLVGPSAVVLPAFSKNAAGVGLGSLDPSVAVTRPGGPLRCVAAAGEVLLDFGPVPDLIGAAGCRE
jgi:metallophosphoesterase superfamily enzyme